MLFVSTRKCHLSLANFHCQQLTKPARIEHVSTNYIQHRDNLTSQQSARRVLPPTHTHTHFDKLPQTAKTLEMVLGNMSNDDLLYKPITPNGGCQVVSQTGAPTPSNQPTISLVIATHITLQHNSAPINVEI